MEDFLSLPPELTYESLSEHTHSPSSSHELVTAPESDWENWASKELTTLHDTDPLFSIPDDSLLQANELYGNITDIYDEHSLTKDERNPSDMMQLTSSNTVSVPRIDIRESYMPHGPKRSLSEDSLDSELEVRSTDNTNTNASTGNSFVIPTLKKRTRTADAPKVSHNIIEKRYRLNLNEKIMYLRDVVPQLKAEADAGNVKQAKGSIISGATDYIKELEARNAKLVLENDRLTAKLHGEDRLHTKGVLGKVVVGGLASMMCVSGMQAQSSTPNLTKRSFADANISTTSWLDNLVAILKMTLLIAALFYIFSPDLFYSTTFERQRPRGKYSQSLDDDCMQEDVQENRELMHNNVSAILEMPCDRPGLFKRILQGCFVLALKIIIGQSGWNVLLNKGLDYTHTNQQACSLLIETQLLGGDKYINQAKLFLSAIQSLGYTMPKEMRAIHFAMVCHGYAPQKLICWCVSLFWRKSATDDVLLQMPLEQLLSTRVLRSLWCWTNGIDDPLIASVRNDETIDTPYKQLASIHASLMQNQILRSWIRGTASPSELDNYMQTLLMYGPKSSRILNNSLYLQSIIEPNDWLEKAMLEAVNGRSADGETMMTTPREVSMQLRCCVLLHLLEKNTTSEEVCDVLHMAELETSALLPGYSSRIVASCISKHRLDDDDGISEALRKISAKLGAAPRLGLRF